MWIQYIIVNTEQNLSMKTTLKDAFVHCGSSLVLMTFTKLKTKASTFQLRWQKMRHLSAM